MSIVKIQGNVSGTGIFTIAAPNSNNNQTVNLPDQSGTLFMNSANGALNVDAAAPANSLVISSAGNVGLGTSSPSYKLDAVGQIRAQESGTGSGDGGLIGATSGANGNAGVLFQTGGSSRWNLTTQGTNGANLRIYNYTLGTTVATFDSSGNVGIGTSSPNAKVDVSGSVNITADSGLNGTWSGLSTRYIPGNNSAYLQSVALSGGAVTGGKELSFDASQTIFRTISGSTFTERVRISAAGGFSVGTTADPGAGAIFATGNITAYYSDDRLKTKLGKIENALDKLCSLDGFYYEANETAQALGYEAKREVGVSAQQMQAVMPEVVAPAPIDAQYLTVRYERTLPLVIEAIKELRLEVQALKAALEK